MGGGSVHCKVHCIYTAYIGVREHLLIGLQPQCTLSTEFPGVSCPAFVRDIASESPTNTTVVDTDT